MSLFFLLLSLSPLLTLSQPTNTNTNSTPYYVPQNPRLEKAYIALQALKRSITSDPNNLTSNWCGPHVCNYTGVFCAPAPDDTCEYTVAGLDLNHGLLSASLPPDLSLLSDLALLHLNSNRFSGCLPSSLQSLRLLYELDLSNNLFSGQFPDVLLRLPSLKYLDIRFNSFSGDVPADLFHLKLDALFINNNAFRFSLPETIANSTVSVLVVANNKIDGCFPRGIIDMAGTLNQLILLNTTLHSCIPCDIGKLKNLTVFDVSFNRLVGELPESVGEMTSLEQLDVAHNMLSGEIPKSVCDLPRLQNFTYSYNYFCGEPEVCLEVESKDDKMNCIAFRPEQRPVEQCLEFLHKPKERCDAKGCVVRSPPPPPPPYW